MTDGRLAVVLHTHMPYVEGFGVWPFGEEWLFEAVATSYVPVLELLDRGAALTLSVTPVLLDQLEAPGVHERLLAFLGELRPEVHRQAAATLEGPLRAEVERAAGDYAHAERVVRGLGEGGLARALARHAAWTSAATHAVLPLCATTFGVRLQLASGIAAHRARPTPGWRGGLWLPECAWAPWLDRLLAAEGVRAVVADLTEHPHDPLRPLRTPAGTTVAPLHRPLVERVWSTAGYPAQAPYRDSHRFAEHRRRPWAIDGRPYDRGRALRQVRADARDFASAARAALGGGGLAVCAFDTELFGEWWYEGAAWLEAMADECGDLLVPLDDALAATGAVGLGALAKTPLDAVSTWGRGRDLSTWSGPQVADLAWSARDAELRVLAAGGPRAGERALRELLALQSSDWAFLASEGTAGAYPRERAAGHRAALGAVLEGRPPDTPIRGLTPFVKAVR